MYIKNEYLEYKREKTQHLHALKTGTHEYNRIAKNFNSQSGLWPHTTPLSAKTIFSLLIQAPSWGF
jgi:hypothetical protein